MQSADADSRPATAETADFCETSSSSGAQVAYRMAINTKGSPIKRTAAPSDPQSRLSNDQRVQLCASAQSASDRIHASSEESKAII